jgi:hypothetical protein
LKDADLNPDKILMEDTHDLPLRARRIRQRPEDVEDSAHAQFTSHRGGVLHG